MFLLLLVWFFAFAPSSDSWRIRPDLQRGRSLCTWSTCSTSWATSGPGHGDGATLDLQKHKQTLMETRQQQLLTDDPRRFWEQLVLPGPEQFLLLNNRPESTTWQSLVKLSGSDPNQSGLCSLRRFQEHILVQCGAVAVWASAAMFLPLSASRCSCSGSAQCILVLVGYSTELSLCVVWSFSTSLNMCIILLQTVEHTWDSMARTIQWFCRCDEWKKAFSFRASARWQRTLEQSLFPRLDVGPVNLSVAAEAVWSGGLINGSSLAGETVCRDRSQSVHTAALHAPHSWWYRLSEERVLFTALLNCSGFEPLFYFFTFLIKTFSYMKRFVTLSDDQMCHLKFVLLYILYKVKSSDVFLGQLINSSSASMWRERNKCLIKLMLFAATISEPVSVLGLGPDASPFHQKQLKKLNN